MVVIRIDAHSGRTWRGWGEAKEMKRSDEGNVEQIV